MQPLLTRAYISKNKENTSETEETNKKLDRFGMELTNIQQEENK